MIFIKKKPQTIAAVDLGSNSFHMTVARIQDGQLHIIDSIKEMVRLASGITEKNTIETNTATRALQCLERFAERLHQLPSAHVRVIGTNALREADRATDFLQQAESALGYPIEVISGIEEARLIYNGVSHCSSNPEQLTLVADIGGGSTELIIGHGATTDRLESLHMGCVAMSMRCFADGKITHKRMQRAILSARQELEPINSSFRQLGWKRAIGSSGTIRSISESINRETTDSKITLKALHKLREKVIDTGHIDKLQSLGVSSERTPVFPGGLAILIAIFESLQIKQMEISHCALREGVLYELMGNQHHNLHKRTIENLSKRYQLDRQHAARVENTAIHLYEGAKINWDLKNSKYQQILSWAAQLHEIGLAISHSRYHHHGSYLIKHSELPGFNRQQQAEIAWLIGLHRRKLRFEEFPINNSAHGQKLLYLMIILRLAVVLHRGRSKEAIPDIQISTKNGRLSLVFPSPWLAEHPLTEADLEQEASYLESINIKLSYSTIK